MGSGSDTFIVAMALPPLRMNNQEWQSLSIGMQPLSCQPSVKKEAVPLPGR
jgi:hypothetical protein